MANVVLHVPPDRAQQMRSELEARNAWDGNFRVCEDPHTQTVGLPVKADFEREVRKQWPQFCINRRDLPPSKRERVKNTKPAKVLKAAVLELCTQSRVILCAEDLLSEIPSKWERHGNLIILPAQAFESSHWERLGTELWRTVAKALSCQRLARASSVTDDGFRSSGVRLLLGESGWVTHVDNGIKYSFDVTKCMFSSGNITEKLRVSSWDCSGQIVVDLFAGIGYFTLPYLVHSEAAHVHACEWNPFAVEALRANLRANGVEYRCTVHPGDNRKLALEGVADRVNLGLIPSSEDSWPVAVRVLKPTGGVLHVHGNVTVETTTSVERIDNANGTITMETMKSGNKSDNTDHWEKNLHTSSFEKEVNCLKRPDVICDSKCEGLKSNDAEHLDRNPGRSSSLKKEGERLKNVAVTTSMCGGKSDSIEHSAEKNLLRSFSLEKEVDCLKRQVKRDHLENMDSICEVLKSPSTNCEQRSANLPSESDPLNYTCNNPSPKLSGKLCSRKESVQESCKRWSAHVSERILSLLKDDKGGRWVTTQLHIEVVKSYAPHVFHVVLDLACLPATGSEQ